MSKEKGSGRGPRIKTEVYRHERTDPESGSRITHTITVHGTAAEARTIGPQLRSEAISRRYRQKREKRPDTDTK